MNSREAIKLSIGMGQFVSLGYLEDLTDDELMQRPVAGCNHVKWQLGHLIVSEHQMIEAVAPGSMPDLPAGFVDKYTKEKAASDAPSDFDSKADLLRLADEQRAGTLAALEAQSDEALSQESPESMRSYAPNVGAAFSLQGSHWLMHAGQWAVLRRQLGRPPLF